MSMAASLLFAAATLALLAGHALRSIRHRLLFPGAGAPRHSALLFGLALGYATSAVLPLHLGELPRIAYVSRRAKIRLSYVAATVLAERLSDVVVLGAASAIFAALAPDLARPLLQGVLPILCGAAGGLVVLALAIARMDRARRLAWLCGSLFNDRIRDGILDLLWSFADLVANRVLVSRRYVAATLGVWTLYAAAYELFAHAVGVEPVAVVFALLGMPLQSLADQARMHVIPALPLLAFTLLPVAAVGLYALVAGGRRALALLNRRQTTARIDGGRAHGIVRERFRQAEDYSAFLASHFAGSNGLVSKFGLSGIADARIEKLFVGGSDAIIALVETAERKVVRKFAAGASAAKLGVQVDWLRRHADRLPVTEVLAARRGEAFFLYDMPYHPDSRDFYDAIHTSPAASSERILLDVVEAMAGLHAATASGEASDATIDRYLSEKVVANAATVLAFARQRFPDGRYTINSQAYALDDWARLLDRDWLARQITRRATCTVHGDLTVENIIVSPDAKPGWYLIDPNPDNIFQTPLLDWAKLMQSLHLGYEGLNRGAPLAIRHAAIEIGFAKSAAYAELHRRMTRALVARLGRAAMRDVAFHEIVNYLRLTPYKIRQDPQKGLLFFACTSILLRRYLAADGSQQRAAA